MLPDVCHSFCCGQTVQKIGIKMVRNPGCQHAADQIHQRVHHHTKVNFTGTDIKICQQNAQHERVEELIKVSVKQSEQQSRQKHRRQFSEPPHPVNQQFPEDKLLPDRRRNDGKQEGLPERRVVQGAFQPVTDVVSRQAVEKTHQTVADDAAKHHAPGRNHVKNQPMSRTEPLLLRLAGFHAAQKQPHQRKCDSVKRHKRRKPLEPGAGEELL